MDDEFDQKLLKQLIPKLQSVSSPRGIVRLQPLDTHCLYFYKESDTMGETTYVAVADTLCFEFLDQICAEFKVKSEYHVRSTRPYSLVHLEPWLTKMKRRYSSKRGAIYDSVTVLDLNAIVPNIKATGVKPILTPQWYTRLSILLILALLFCDVYLFFESAVGIIRILRWDNTPILSGFVYGIHHLLMLSLGLLSPVYLLLASIIYLKRQTSELGKIAITAQIILTFVQVVYTTLIPNEHYHRPDHREQLTTLQQWADIFGSFSINFVVIVLKVLYVITVLQSGFTSLFKRLKVHTQ
jgi:hypothetical protein